MKRHRIVHIDEDDRLMTLCGIEPPPVRPEGQHGDSVEICMDCHDMLRNALAKKS